MTVELSLFLLFLVLELCRKGFLLDFFALLILQMWAVFVNIYEG